MTDILNPTHYRLDPTTTIGTHITRATVEVYLDRHQIQCLMSHGKWWTIRRNGVTRRWKRDPNRIRIPFKMGLRGYGAITEADFVSVTHKEEN